MCELESLGLPEFVEPVNAIIETLDVEAPLHICKPQHDKRLHKGIPHRSRYS